MMSLNRIAWVSALYVGMASVAVAQQEKPADKPMVMQPNIIGPRTEAVDIGAYAKVIHISPAGSDQGDGSAEKPFATVAYAVSSVGNATSEKRAAILVAAGEYKGETITLKPYIDLYGGFDAGNWQRDIAAHRSVLDGEGQRRVLVAADNSRIDGFVIQNAKVRGPGAGILCDHASPTISNNTIVNNTALEPEGMAESKMLHQLGNEGGGIACLNGSSPVINNNIISHNITGIGGGAGITAANWSMPHVLNNVMTDNVSGVNDIDISRSSNGAAISASHALHREPLRMKVINNLIANNRTGEKSKSDAGGIYLEYDSSPVIAANWILGNWCADDGSGIYVMKSSQPLFTGNIVAGNNSSAIRLSKEGRGEIENNLVFANANPLICISSWMVMKNNTIVDNHSGISYGNPYAPHLKPSIITGNLIYGNKGGSGLAPANSGETREDPPIVHHNDIEGGYAGGEGNFDEKPQFADDGVNGQIGGIEYDENQIITTISADISGGQSLTGRVINVGDKWSVVRSSEGGKIVVWGDMRPQKEITEFTISPTYQLLTALAGNVGAK